MHIAYICQMLQKCPFILDQSVEGGNWSSGGRGGGKIIKLRANHVLGSFVKGIRGNFNNYCADLIGILESACLLLALLVDNYSTCSCILYMLTLSYIYIYDLCISSVNSYYKRAIY